MKLSCLSPGEVKTNDVVEFPKPEFVPKKCQLLMAAAAGRLIKRIKTEAQL